MAPTAPGLGVTCFPLSLIKHPPHTHQLRAFPPTPFLLSVFSLQGLPPPGTSNNSLKSCSRRPNTNALNFLNLPFVKIFVKMIKVDSNLY